jgi:hypothetical protein
MRTGSDAGPLAGELRMAIKPGEVNSHHGGYQLPADQEDSEAKRQLPRGCDVWIESGSVKISRLDGEALPGSF